MFLKWLRKYAKLIAVVAGLITVGALIIIFVPGAGVFIAGAGAVILTPILHGVAFAAGGVALAGGGIALMEPKLVKYDQMEKELEKAHAESIRAQEDVKTVEKNAVTNNAEYQIVDQKLSLLVEQHTQLKEQVLAQGKMLQTLTQADLQNNAEVITMLDQLPENIGQQLRQQGLFSQSRNHNEAATPPVHPNGAQPRERKSFIQGQ